MPDGGESSGASEVVVPASSQEVVQRTIGTPTGASAPAASPSHDHSSVAMPPLPVVSRSAVAGGARDGAGRSPGDSYGVPASGGAEVPLIGATDLTGPSSFVAALGQPPDQAEAAPAEDLPVVSRTVAGQADPASVQRVAWPVAPARLLWPRQPVVQRSRSLSSERPLTVPYETTAGVDAPAVQRISYDNRPVQRSEAQTITQTPTDPRPAVVAQKQPMPVMLPSEPETRETVRALPLQRMFGDLTTSGSSEPVQTTTEWQVPVQRDAIPTAPVIQAAEATGAAPAAGTTAAPGVPAPGGGVDVDEMAKRLYEPLTARLRAELWLDRERAGLVTDRWR
jgi:hypothetical protein